MSKKKDNSHWFIIIAILLIIVIVVALSLFSKDGESDKEEEIKKRNEEEEKLIKELEELRVKQEIYEKHEFINGFNQNYLEQLCEKRYHQLIKVLLLLLVFTNVILYLIVPKIDAISLFTWNGIALGILNLIALFFFLSVKNAKKYLKDLAMDYIEYRVYENRDKEYFKQKVQLYKIEIEKIQTEIQTKTHQLNLVRNETKLL